MIKIENWEVVGWEHAIRGMRNPMNSWERSDSKTITHMLKDEESEIPGITEMVYIPCVPYTSVGSNDHDLMMRLAKGGPVHAKYRRMINVYVDLTAPLYWWKEFDTYKVGTVANSCSTMHKIHAKEFTLDDFSCEHLLDAAFIGHNDAPLIDASGYKDGSSLYSPTGVLGITIEMLNKCRDRFLKTNDKKYWWQMIQLLPSSYNQKRTVMLNYEVLHNIYYSRNPHKMWEGHWQTIIEWIESLPYSEIICCRETENTEN